MRNAPGVDFGCALNADLVVEVQAAPPAVPAEPEPAIEAAWDATQARAGGRLFNGRIFSVTML